MYKKTITYTDFDDIERTEEHYFNLSKAELTEMNFSAEGGLEKMIREIINTRDMKRLIELFKRFILMSYGEKSLDGRRFVKIVDGHKLADDFSQTGAYDALFMELANDEKAAIEFILGILPKELAKGVADHLQTNGKMTVK